MHAKFVFLTNEEKKTQSLIKYVSSIYGEDNTFIDGDGFISLRKKYKVNLKPLRMMEQKVILDGEIENLANYILSYLNDKHEGLNLQEISDNIIKQGLPTVYKELGLISQLEKSKSEFELNVDEQHKRDILCKDLLPILIREFQPSSCVAIQLDPNIQQPIFSMLKIGWMLQEYNIIEVQKRLDNGAGEGVSMLGGVPILDMLEAYSSLANAQYSISLKSTFSAFHFISKGVFIFSNEMRKSLQNFFQSRMSPMTESAVSNNTLNLNIELTEDYVWKYLKFSVNCINNLINFSNNPFNFLNNSNEVQVEKQIQFFSAIYLLYSDISLIHSNSNRHIQNHLSFSAIEKLANLVLGYVEPDPKLKLEERHIVHILLSFKTKEMIINALKLILENKNPELYENLKLICEYVYNRLADKMDKMFHNTNEKNIANFYHFRRFYAHGAFLKHNVYKKNFFNNSLNIPFEITLLPYCLMLALSSDPEHFFSYLKKEIENYDSNQYNVDLMQNFPFDPSQRVG